MEMTQKLKMNLGKAAVIVCLIVAFAAFCLTGCAQGTAEAPRLVELDPAITAEDLAEYLTSEEPLELKLSGDVKLDAPIQVVGIKRISGTGTLSAAKDMAGGYMLTMTEGAQLTVNPGVVIDGANLAGGIHIAPKSTLVLGEQVTVCNASANASNVLVEGTFELNGGALLGAAGHNLINKGETSLLAGQIRSSGKDYAAVYNEGTLTQNGGVIANGYDNVVNASGAQFTFRAGSNENAANCGITVASGASATMEGDAILTKTTGFGVLVDGKFTMDGGEINQCTDTMIRVSASGELNFNFGMLVEGKYNAIDNDGVCNANGGIILDMKQNGIVNTGTLNVKGVDISECGNKGIDNKLQGKAVLDGSAIYITGNRFGVANSDKATMEITKATIGQSLTTNVYAYGGTVNIHDMKLGASDSNNIRVQDADVVLENVQVLGNSGKGSSTTHGIVLEGGSVTAKNVAINNTTGSAVRNKGGVFKGTDIVMDNNRQTAIHVTNQDVTGLPSSTVITNLTVTNQGYMSVLSAGDGVTQITNAEFGPTPSNNVRCNSGTLLLKDVKVLGHNEKAGTAHHGIYLEGGVIEAENLHISNTRGHGIRNKGGKVVATDVVVEGARGDCAISNTYLPSGAAGTIQLTNLNVSGSKSKNIVSEAGAIVVSNATLQPCPGSNIKVTGGSVTVNNSKIMGTTPGTPGNIHAVILENGYGAFYANDVTIEGGKLAGIRNKTGFVQAKNLTIRNCGSAAIDNGEDKNYKLKGITQVDGLITENCGNNGIVANAGEIRVANGVLGITASNNVKTGGTGLIVLTNTTVNGSEKEYGVLAEGGTIQLDTVNVNNAKKGGIRANRDTSVVEGKNIVIEKCVQGVSGSAGKITLDGLTAKATDRNIAHDGATITVSNATLSNTSIHNIKSTKGELNLTNVEILGSENRGIMIEPGESDGQPKVTLVNVTISNTASAGLENRGGIVTAEKLTVDTAKGQGICNYPHADGKTAGSVTVKELNTDKITGNTLLNTCGGSISVNGGTLGKALKASDFTAHSVKATAGTISLENVTVEGTADTGAHAVLAEGGNVNLKKVTIQDAGNAAIRVNKAASTATCEDLTITGGNNGISASAGTVTVKGLTANAKSRNIAAEGATITVTDGTLGNTTTHNIKINKGSLTLNNVQIQGSANRGIMVEPGASDGQPKVTLTDVSIADTANSALENRGGIVTATNLNITGASANAILSKSKEGSVTVTGGTIGTTAVESVKTEKGLISLNGVTVEGSDVDALAAAGGNLELNDVEVKKAGLAAIAVSAANSQVTGNGVTLNGCVTGIAGTEGTVNITNLTSNATNRNISGDGVSVTINGGTLGETTAHNIKVTANTVTLTNVTVNKAGTANAIQAEGGNLVLTDVTLKNAVIGVRINKAQSSVVATNLTIDNCSYGISGNAGTVEITNLVGNAKDRNIAAEGATITVHGGTFGTTSTHNVKVNKGSLTLEDVTIKGSSGRGIMVEPGASDGQPTVSLARVSMSGIKSNGLENRGGIITASNLTIRDTDGMAVYHTGHKDGTTQGATTIAQLTTSGIKSHNVFIDKAGTVSITGGTLGQTLTPASGTAHSVRATAGLIGLADVTIDGTTQTGAHGVIAEGGNIGLSNVTIRNTKASGVRVNKEASVVDLNDVTILNAGDAGVSASNGTLQGGNLTVNGAKNSAIAISGGSMNFVGGTLTNNGTTHTVDLTGGNLTLENFAVTDPATGYGIHAAANGLTLSGSTKANVYFDAAASMSVGKALTDGAAITVNWAEGKAPAGIAIQFAAGTMAGAEEKITLTGYYATDYKLVYVDDTASLAEKAVYILSVGTERFETAAEALAYLNQQTGDVTLTALADTTVAQTIEVPTGMNLTLAAAEGKHLGAAVTMNGGKATVESNVTLTALNVTAGGQVIYNGNTATETNPVTVTVKGLPNEQVLTIAESNTATADCFKLVDAQGNVYGGELENGVLSIYTAEITDQATLDAGIAGAPEGKIGYLLLKDSFAMDAQSTVTAGKVLIMTDDGTERTISRGTTTGTMLRVESGAKLTVRSSTAVEKIFFDGGKLDGKKGSGMLNTLGELTMEYVAIVNNQWDANNRGLGLYANTGSVVKLDHVRFENISNTYAAKAVALIVNGSTVEMNSCTVANCTAKGSGVIEVVGSLKLTSCTFQGNTASYGGAIYVANNANSRLEVDSCLFENNHATANGGVLQVDFNNPDVCAVTIRNSIFRNNSAASEGGAIGAATGACMNISDTTFKGNTAAKVSSGEPDTKVWGNDIRLGGATNVVTLSGRVEVSIFHNQIAVVRFSGPLTAGSNVKLDGRPIKYTAASYDVMEFASEDDMLASKAYISLDVNLTDAGKCLVFEGKKAMLQNIPVVSTQAELEQALANAANIPVIKLAANTTISVENVTFPTTPVTIQGQTGSVLKYAGSTEASVVTFPEDAKVTFRNVTVDGNAVGKLLIPAGADVTLENSTVTNVKSVSNRSVDVCGNLNLRGTVTIDGANWGLGVQLTGKVTSEAGSKLIIKNATYGVTTHNSANVHLTQLETSNVSNSAVYNDGNSVTVIDNASLGASASGKHTVNMLKGTLTLSNATITNPGGYAVIQKDGVLNLNKVTALNAPGWSVCVDGANAELNATDLTISGSKGTCLQIQNGTANVTNLVTTNMASSHSVKVVAGTLNITGMNLGVSNSNNLNIAGGEVNLHGTCTITGAKANYGIRIDAAGTVNVHPDCVLSIANVAKKGVVLYGGKLNLAGTVNATMEFDGTGTKNRTLNVTGNLGGAVQIDWIGDDDHPSGNAITFASKAVLDASKSAISLGSNRGAAYELTYGETAATLTAKTSTAGEEPVVE